MGTREGGKVELGNGEQSPDREEREEVAGEAVGAGELVIVNGRECGIRWWFEFDTNGFLGNRDVRVGVGHAEFLNFFFTE